MTNNQQPERTPEQTRTEVVDGKTVTEWDKDWTRVERGFRAPQQQLDGLLGLYRATVGGDTKYIGQSTEINEGLKKRLRDYSRDSDSARDHYGAQMIMEHIDTVECDVIVVDVTEESVENIKSLKKLMIELYKPEWNADPAIIAARRHDFYEERSRK